MAEPLPKFDEPPLVETTLGVQFFSLAGFSAPKAGWFWRDFLIPITPNIAWSRIAETAKLEDRFERFGEKEAWGRPGLALIAPTDPQRVQIGNESGERMVQIQDTRFILNWIKQSEKYPHYAVLSKEFDEYFAAFKSFSREAKFSPLEINQWEVVYTNHIAKSDLWQGPQEWVNVLPDLKVPKAVVAIPEAKPISFEWRYAFPEERGRLYLSLQHARKLPDDWTKDFMQLILTARGPVDFEKGWTVENGFTLGHEAIVRTFASITSPAAHKTWKRRV